MYERTYHTRVLKQDSVKSPKKPFPWKRTILSVAVMLVVVGIIFLIRAQRLQVHAVNVVGTNVADPVEVSDFVMDRLQGNYVWILPKASIVLVSPDALKQAIADHFPRFKSVTVTRDSLSSLLVDVIEYPGVYLWCDSNDACSFMDEQGTVFADAPYFSGSAYLKIYGGGRMSYPFQPITGAQLSQIKIIADRLQSMEIAPLSFSYNADHELKVYFFHNTDRTPILFDPSDDVSRALDTLYTGLRTQPLARLYRDHNQILQYLDLRFANKVVYKFQ